MKKQTKILDREPVDVERACVCYDCGQRLQGRWKLRRGYYTPTSREFVPVCDGCARENDITVE